MEKFDLNKLTGAEISVAQRAAGLAIGGIEADRMETWDLQLRLLYAWRKRSQPDLEFESFADSVTVQDISDAFTGDDDTKN